MKKAAIAGIFLISLISQSLTAQNSIDWEAVRQAYFDKYHPTDTPAWIFPLVFEEGNGGRDTLYFGYDPRSVAPAFGIDTSLGERWIVPDSGKFYALFYPSWTEDSIMKVYFNRSFSGRLVEFQNGILPLTIWWEPAAFYSDSLPFADQSPAPRAEGLFTNPGGIELKGEPYSGFCSLQFPILLTDTAKSPDFCYRKDSLVYLRRFSGGNVLPMLSFGVDPWTGEWLGIKDLTDKVKLRIYPQPATEFVRIESTEEWFDQIMIFNSLGQVFLKMEWYFTGSPISLGALPSGLYFLQVKKEDYSIIKKLIKL